MTSQLNPGGDLTETERSTTKKQAPHRGLVCLIGAWIACWLIASPWGNFPMNDDWSFAAAVRTFVETGQFRPLGWTGMPLLSHVLWGSLFTLPKGFSFDALRLSTATLSLIGISSTYALVQHLCGSRRVALICASLIAFNPIYFALSAEFMTDVPFTALLTASAYCFCRTLARLHRGWYLAALLLSLAAVLNRQIGIVVPLAYALISLSAQRVSLKRTLWAFIPFLYALLALGCLELWLRSAHALPALYHKQNQELLGSFANPNWPFITFITTVSGIFYLGLFLSPLLLFCIGGPGGKGPGLPTASRRLQRITVAALMAALTMVLLLVRQGMPLAGNILYPGGIGPVVLINGDPRPIGVLASLWWAWTLLAVLGGTILLVLLRGELLSIRGGNRTTTTTAKDDIRLATRFCLLASGLYVAPLFIHGFFDRYLIPVLPLMMAWLSTHAQPLSALPTQQTPLRRVGTMPSLLALLAFGSFVTYSVLGTHDLFSWNRARWQMLNQLTDIQHISPHKIDGGFEFNGWLLYSDSFKPKPGKSWWWVDDNSFVISFSRFSNARIIDQRTFPRLLPPGQSTLYLQQRKDVTLK